MGSQVDINTYADANTHAKEGRQTRSGLIGTNTQCHSCLHVTVQRDRADMVSQVDINSCTDGYTHSNQGL